MGQPSGCSIVYVLIFLIQTRPSQDTQKGRPARPQRVKIRGVPGGYVEGLNDARTKLADFFSILLIEDDGFSAIYQDPPLNMAAHSAGQHNLFQVPALPH